MHSLVDDKDYSLENAASNRKMSYLVVGVILGQIIAWSMRKKVQPREHCEQHKTTHVGA
jgi:hypothetical protein